MRHGGDSDKTWSTGEGNGKPLQYSCFENTMNSMKRGKDMTLKNELTRSRCSIFYWRRAPSYSLLNPEPLSCSIQGSNGCKLKLKVFKSSLYFVFLVLSSQPWLLRRLLGSGPLSLAAMLPYTRPQLHPVPFVFKALMLAKREQEAALLSPRSFTPHTFTEYLCSESVTYRGISEM